MRRALRIATVAVPAGFVLACTIGDGTMQSEDLLWLTTIEVSPEGCPTPPHFGSRIWSEYADQEEIIDPLDTGKVVGKKLRWYPLGPLPETESTIFDCPLDGDAFVCEPYGEDVPGGRLHVLAFTGERDAQDHITGTVEVAGTTGDNPVTGDSDVVWCTDTWTFDAVRLIDAKLTTARTDGSCALDGTVASAQGGAPAVMEIANNSSTEVIVGLIDAAGGETELGTYLGGSIAGWETTMGTWYRVSARDDGHCLGVYEVTEVYTVVVVHGGQD